MDVDQISHLEQYKMLREEIMQNLREGYRTEVLAAVGVAAIYTWLLIHRDSALPRVLWFVPSAVIALASLRCLVLTIQIRIIAGYLRRVEEAAFKQDENLPGWERYMARRSKRSFTNSAVIVAAIAWIFGFLGSILISWALAH